MAGLNVNKAEFIKSAASTQQFIRSSIPAIAFAGKSNVGKSSVINRMLNRKNFARVGAQPGKTIHVNYFFIDGKLYFVDLPGYGYAKVSQSEKERWGKLMESFFAEPDLMDLGVMIKSCTAAFLQACTTSSCVAESFASFTLFSMLS